LGAREVAGRTRYSVISSGTELAVYQGQLAGGSFPTGSGYAAIFEVTDVGPEVSRLWVGDLAFCMGNHRSWQRVGEDDAIPVPPNLPAEQAGFARLMGVTMSTLVTTTARPPDRVVVTGLGVIGVFAAQVFGAAGYRVLAVDPDARRRELALALGVAQVAAEPPLDDPNWAGQVSLVLECAGHEGAALAGVNLVRKRGEVVLVGVPWARRTDFSAQTLTNAIFHKYAVVRSGWEWEVPRQPQDFVTGSIYANLAAAMNWLADGRVRVEGLYQVMSPRDCQQAYQGLLHHALDKSAVVFDWSRL
jgi:threonine dehydrogenase-like Zn-dependent dehydrogenase